jgi:hypothetical protein
MNAGGPGLAAQVARGTVSAEETGQPVAGVLVLLLDARGVEVARTQSDPAGRYSVTAPAAGNYRLRFLIPGYRPLASSSFELAPGISREQPLRLIAAAPELLDTLVVEGRPVLALLAPFHRRRTFGFGTFLNREEIDEKRAADVSGVLTRLRVLDVLGDLGDGGGRRVGIRNRGGFAAGDLCPAAVYVNGAFAGVSGEVDIDLIVPLNAVEAMEVYRPGEVPIDFPLDGGGCGLVSLWSGPNVRDTTGVVRHLALAAHAGTRLGSEGVRDGRLGLSLSYTFTRGIEFYPSVNLHIGFPNTTPDPALAGWQAILALRARPMGPETPWYVGTGLSHVQLTGDLRADLTNDTGGQHHVLLTGLLLPGGPWRAYVEVHVLNPLAISSAQTSLFVGLARRFY